MKRLLCTVSAFLAISLAAYTQTQTIKIKTSDGGGMDAHTWYADPTTNFGTSALFAVRAWTIDGAPHTSRAYFYFDLSDIPSNATIESATFTVFADRNDSRKQDAMDPDSIILNMVTGDWNESTLTWNNAPAVHNTRRVAVMQNTEPYPDYSFPVTDIVKFWLANPSQNKGVRLALKNEQPYTLFYGATSDNEAAAYHPVLEITYTATSGITENDKHTFLVRTLGHGQYRIGTTSAFQINAYRIITMQGQVIQNQDINNEGEVSVSLSGLPKGFYIFEARTSTSVHTQILRNE